MLVRIGSIPTCSPRRNAFTLFEVLLALSLMVVLATALIGAIDLYRQISSTGYAEIEQAQLARAVLRQVELDIRSSVYRSAEEVDVEEALAGESSADEQTGEFTFMSDDVQTASIATGAGIIGDETTLIVHAARPPRQVDFFSPVAFDVSANDPLRELRSVSYFLATPGTDGLQGLAGELFSEQNPDFIGGLTRLDGDRFSIAFSDANRDTVSLMANAQLMASEIQLLQFRYFDGAVWQTAWDSAAMQSLPLAIEITIGFQNRSNPPERFNATPEFYASQLYRYVVAVPGVAPVTTN